MREKKRSVWGTITNGPNHKTIVHNRDEVADYWLGTDGQWYGKIAGRKNKKLGPFKNNYAAAKALTDILKSVREDRTMTDLEIYLAGMRDGLSEAKGKTYAQARQEILSYLAKQGWDVKPNLKVAHATSPDKSTRLWFKAQAVYHEPGGRGVRWNFGAAHSMWLDDLRTMTPEQFMRAVERWNEIKKDKRDSSHPW